MGSYSFVGASGIPSVLIACWMRSCKMGMRFMYRLFCRQSLANLPKCGGISYCCGAKPRGCMGPVRVVAPGANRHQNRALLAQNFRRFVSETESQKMRGIANPLGYYLRVSVLTSEEI